MINRIFLDLDDVLNSFTMPALVELGCDVDEDDLSCFPQEAGYDMCEAFGIIQGRPIDPVILWDSLTYKFWCNLPKSKECKYLMELLESEFDRPSLCVLSSPPSAPYVADAKILWIQNNLPKWLHRSFLIGPRKEFCSHPNALLIDDNDRNCYNFTLGGGKSIIFPRPWNSKREHYKNPMAYIHDRLKEIY
jgi:5'(3')-deoxyribonucleotidase